MRIPDILLHCTAFIGVGASDEDFRPCGTVFFVRVPLEEKASHGQDCMVTARHVLKAIDEERSETPGGQAALRVNAADGTATYGRLPRDIRWTTHPNAEVCDVAVLPLPFERNERGAPLNDGGVPMDIRTLPLNFFELGPLPRAKAVGVGDEVYTIGLFASLQGERKNSPMVRVGNIAMTPEEPVWMTDGYSEGEAHVYLIESRSLGGLSGSPVLARTTAHLPDYRSESGQEGGVNAMGPLLLLGLNHGHFPIYPEDGNKVLPRSVKGADLWNEEKHINMGIAMVVPAKAIHETLMHPDLVQQRKEGALTLKRETMPKPD